MPHRKLRVIVVGAGAFGGWAALHLLRGGAQVTLFDSWGPGNSRASSGGESRVLRATYGPDPIYVRMVLRSLQLWREHQEHWRLRLFHKIGSIWMAGEDDAYERAAVGHLSAAGVSFEKLSCTEASQRFPQVNFDGVRYVIHEANAGYLEARLACEMVLHSFLAEGGDYHEMPVAPGEIRNHEMQAVRTSKGDQVQADQIVFACGAWMGRVFPDVIGDKIRATRQEVLFFGTPPGDRFFSEEQMPVWVDRTDGMRYGIPGNQGRGFKIANHVQGQEIDPDSHERLLTATSVEEMRRYLAFRFPVLADAPLVDSRVCQYENTPDEHFLIDRHPAAQNVWLICGGSGHGFKHSPAIGEIVARLVRGDAIPDPFFQLSRFDKVRSAAAQVRTEPQGLPVT